MDEASETLTVRLVVEEIRRRWPHARARACSNGVRWTDGPAVCDVRQAVAGSGQADRLVPLVADDRAQRREGGPGSGQAVLERTWSNRVLAHVTLVATEVDGDPANLLDELRLYEIPASSPPDLGMMRPHAGCWRRAETLAGLARAKGPVRAASKVAVRRRTLAFERLGAAAGEGLDRGARRTSPRGPVLTHETEAGFTEKLYLPHWPDRPITALLAPVTEPLTVQLRWIDGPTERHVLEHVAEHGLVDPLAGCTEVTTRRFLSPVGLAAAVVLHQLVHRRPYRDPTAGAHWMQRWKVASVRKAELRGRHARQRLVRLQDLVSEQQLPLAGPLQVQDHGSVSGEWVWAAAEILVGLLDRPPPTAHCEPGNSARRLSVDLAEHAWRIGTEGLELLMPPAPDAGCEASVEPAAITA